VQALVNPRRDFWRGRRVLVVGHTGFKGSWLSLWLHRMGASVTGLSLPPPTEPSLFALAGLDALIETQIGDIRDYPTVTAALTRWKPEVVFHLAAQALVRRSYREPIETFTTNVLGTVHVLEAIRATPSVRCTVVVTSDKCYENREWPWAYREIDPVGGHEPYSASKGCAELVAASYRHAFVRAIATARAGNVVGGGDWAEDRLLPDCIRALKSGEPIAIRNPHAVRPWQHVLEPLCGYMILAERLTETPARFGDAWNFGPPGDVAQPVGWVASRVVEHWGERATWNVVSGDGPHEAEALIVDPSKARARLGWTPRLTLSEALRWTVDWYRRQALGEPALALTDAHITEYAAMSTA
jgi:CDP-glucose 4,6-dehydratase